MISVWTENMKTEEINELLSFFKTELLARRSKMTEAKAVEISEQIKADW